MNKLYNLLKSTQQLRTCLQCFWDARLRGRLPFFPFILQKFLATQIGIFQPLYVVLTHLLHQVNNLVCYSEPRGGVA
jgi:hypothetical protein